MGKGVLDMNLEKLKVKEIVEILDGDVPLGYFESLNFPPMPFEVKMPRLSGPEICTLANRFGATLTYDQSKARWEYMFDLIDYGISSGKAIDIISYLFNEANFARKRDPELSSRDFKIYYKRTVVLALERINSLLDFDGIKMVVANKKVLLVPNVDTSEVSLKNIKSVKRDYIKSIFERAIDEVEAENYDSAITKARTTLEEVFIYVLEEKELSPNEKKGDIGKLYKQVRDEYHMHQDKDADKRINKLLSGLNSIVSAVAEMRNKSGDAHGMGKKRLNIDKHHARLAVNAAMIMADFILSVEEKANGEEDY